MYGWRSATDGDVLVGVDADGPDLGRLAGILGGLEHARAGAAGRGVDDVGTVRVHAPAAISLPLAGLLKPVKSGGWLMYLTRP